MELIYLAAVAFISRTMTMPVDSPKEQLEVDFQSDCLEAQHFLLWEHD